jgi:hypothetical protein
MLHISSTNLPVYYTDMLILLADYNLRGRSDKMKHSVEKTALENI